ncbi:MAG: Holliday junction resolvase RuvX [Candidatus Uhrbacteria bacterium]|nr:Holliday junction resolvase RuvX [Candidatus Uhrbacteria bacterium]
MKYLGIDYGLSKIGLALGDSETGIASPVDVIANTPHTIEDIKQFMELEGVDELVVGVPLPTGDYSGEQLEITQSFIDALREAGLVVHSVDESYTSAESQRIQEEEGSDVEEDALAAMLILQGFLDEKRATQ